MTCQEIIGMLCLDSINLKSIYREVMQILGDDYITPPYNRRSQHMTIIWIRQFKCFNKRFVPCDKGITHSSIH